MAKLDIDFILIDESVVMYGFRALMSGAMLDNFTKNPVMLLQHNRPKDYVGKDDIVLPIGKWYDIRVENDKLLAKPDFDDSDEMAMRVQKKVEGGYMNGASIALEPMALSEDPEDMLPGQCLPTLTKWGLLEASIVDIPNCRGSLAIRNSAGKSIALSKDTDNAEVEELFRSLKPKNTDMSILKLMAITLGLADTATEDQVTAKLKELKTAADAAGETSTKLSAAEAKVKELEDKERLSLVTGLVDKAIGEKKLSAGDRDKYIKLATADYDTTEELIKGMTAYSSIENNLSGTGSESNAAAVAELMKESGRNLYMSGKLETLRKLSFPDFKIKYKEYYGQEFAGQA